MVTSDESLGPCRLGCPSCVLGVGSIQRFRHTTFDNSADDRWRFPFRHRRRCDAGPCRADGNGDFASDPDIRIRVFFGCAAAGYWLSHRNYERRNRRRGGARHIVQYSRDAGRISDNAGRPPDGTEGPSDQSTQNSAFFIRIRRHVFRRRSCRLRSVSRNSCGKLPRFAGKSGIADFVAGVHRVRHRRFRRQRIDFNGAGIAGGNGGHGLRLLSAPYIWNPRIRGRHSCGSGDPWRDDTGRGLQIA